MAEFKIEVDGFIGSFVSLLQGGVPIKTIIDIGSADGQFGLYCLFLKRDLQVLNIDANEIFEASLKKLKDELGIPYRITALSAYPGRLMMNNAPNNLYGFQVTSTGKDNKEKKYIDCITLDEMLSEYDLPEPYFMKMDVENNEFNILQGASKTLAKTAAILMEQHISSGRNQGDFLDRCSYLAGRDFSLYDIREISYQKRNLNLSAIDIRIEGDSNPKILSTFHPIFINRKFDFRHLEDQTNDLKKEADVASALQQRLDNRRSQIIKSNQKLIDTLNSK